MGSSSAIPALYTFVWWNCSSDVLILGKSGRSRPLFSGFDKDCTMSPYRLGSSWSRLSMGSGAVSTSTEISRSVSYTHLTLPTILLV